MSHSKYQNLLKYFIQFYTTCHMFDPILKKYNFLKRTPIYILKIIEWGIKYRQFLKAGEILSQFLQKQYFQQFYNTIYLGKLKYSFQTLLLKFSKVNLKSIVNEFYYSGVSSVPYLVVLKSSQWYMIKFLKMKISIPNTKNYPNLLIINP